MDENQARLVTYQGAKPADQIMGILLFFGTNQYKYYHNYLYGQWNKQISQGK
jgi:hypothetical protein